MLLFANCQILFGFQVFSMDVLPCVIESRRLHSIEPALCQTQPHQVFTPFTSQEATSVEVIARLRTAKPKVLSRLWFRQQLPPEGPPIPLSFPAHYPSFRLLFIVPLGRTKTPGLVLHSRLISAGCL